MSVQAAVREKMKRKREGTVVTARELRALGSERSVSKALSKLASNGELFRLERGAYVVPRRSKVYGNLPPAPEKVVRSYGNKKGVTIVPVPAAAANRYGLTTQVPSNSVYLTSGKPRTVAYGPYKVRLRKGERWQTALGNTPEGEAVRALGWVGPEKASKVAGVVLNEVNAQGKERIREASSSLPEWMADTVASP